MPHCTKCGTAVADNAGFCPSCGAPQQAAPAGAVPAAAPLVPAGEGLSQNAAGALSYVLGWVTGLIFYLVDKRPYVRFHARQSIVLFGCLHLILIVGGMLFISSAVVGGLHFFSPAFLILRIVDLLAFILWILCMVKAYQGQLFRVPVAADLADQIFGKS
ncbi:MAG: DUF4870 domain-containing protein [Candidatus Acidiferrales bacterium]